MKFITCAIFVVLALQGLSQAKVIKSQSEKSIQDDIAAVISWIEEEVGKRIDDVLAQIEKFEAGLQNEVEQIQNIIDEEITKLQEKIKQLLNAAGIEAPECLEQADIAIAALEEKLKTESDDCTSSVITDIDEDVATFKAAANRIKSEMEDLKATISKCANLECVVTAVKQVEQLIADVTKLVKDVENLTVSLATEVGVCVKNVVVDAEVGGIQIEKDCLQCILNHEN